MVNYTCDAYRLTWHMIVFISDKLVIVLALGDSGLNFLISNLSNNTYYILNYV